MNGQSLELFYIDGRPDGIVTAEMFNWTGSVLMAPRTELGRLLQQPQARHSGIYILVGEDDSGTPRAYIGESDAVATRIRSHDLSKEWWTQVAIVTATENRLNKAHVQYLESCLIARARAVGRVPLDNSNQPTLPSLSAADVSKMEAFLINLLVVLPALRIDIFVERTRGVKAPDERGQATQDKRSFSEAPEFELNNTRQSLRARAILQDGEFIVLQGSESRLEWSEKSSGHNYAEMHAELCRSGVLQIDGNHRVFTTNYAFPSASSAAAAVNGRPGNGTIEWTLAGSKQTYKDWERARLEVLASGGESPRIDALSS